jgi:hypothetical protein
MLLQRINKKAVNGQLFFNYLLINPLSITAY